MSAHHRKGSTQSLKVVAHAAKDQRLVCVRTDGTHIDGMVVGLDDYHWVILDRVRMTHLVHKSLAVLSVFPEPGVTHEEDISDTGIYKYLCEAAEPFRRFVLHTVFHHEEGAPSPASTSKERVS